jgi:hypothetical protein
MIRRVSPSSSRPQWNTSEIDRPNELNTLTSKSWWRWEELNLRHGAYETPALPLSYTADSRELDEVQSEILPRYRPILPENMPT